MAKAYDLIVVGSGTAAMVASHRTASAGWKVAVIDYRPFGGTCALRGCDPKKMLITGAQVIDDIRRMSGFVSPNTLEVDGNRLEAKHVLIATGARPVPLGFPGEEHLVTNEEFLEMNELPSRIVLVGGGYIAAEFSHIAARAGAKITVLQRGERMLMQFDPDLVDWSMESFRRVGIDVRTKHVVEAVEKKGSSFVVRATTGNGKQTFEADLVVHAAGRIPDFEHLDLGAAGVDRDEHGRLKLNDFLQSVSNPAVYAAGDAAAQGPPLTPVSSHDAKVVVGNLLEGNRHRPDYRGVPSVAFTIPPIAAVGMSEQQARESGRKFRVKSEKTSNWYTARRVAESVYGHKVLVEEGTEHILGAHLVGPHVDEVINIFGLAIRHGLTAADLKTTMFAYPTGASDIGDML